MSHSWGSKDSSAFRKDFSRWFSRFVLISVLMQPLALSSLLRFVHSGSTRLSRIAYVVNVQFPWWWTEHQRSSDP